MNDAIYIQMPVLPVPAIKLAATKQPCCTRQDCKDYSPQIVFVSSLFIGALIGLIIFLVHIK
jgi:hypothetical protein